MPQTLTAPTETRRRNRSIDCPQTIPLLALRAIGRGTMIIRYSDDTGRGAKPDGASDLQLFVAIGDAHDAPISQARFHRKYTNSLMTVDFDMDDDGKVATFYGRWSSRRGDTGPWSLPLSVRIVAR